MTPCLFQNYFAVPSNNSHFKAIFSNLRGESILSFFILCFFYLGDLLLLDYTLHNFDGIFYLDVMFSTCSWMRHFFYFAWCYLEVALAMLYFLLWCVIFLLDDTYVMFSTLMYHVLPPSTLMKRYSTLM